MAISKPASTNGSNTASSGTTCLVPASSGTITVGAGDIIMLSCSLLATSNTASFSKNAGTAVLSTISTPITKANGNAVLAVSWVTVTTGGTVQFKATSSGTITNCVFEIQTYRGSSGVGQTANGSGSSGTAITGTISSTAYANSWVILFGVSVSATALTAGTNMAASPIVGTSNITGSTNDLSAGIGSNESALSAGTNESVTFNQGNNSTFAWIAVELVQQFTKAGTGTLAASASNIASSKKSASGGISASAAKIASAMKSASAAVAGSAAQRVATNVKAASASMSGSAAHAVTSNLKSASASIAVLASKIASSRVAGSGALLAAAQELASSVLAAAGSLGISAAFDVLTNLVDVEAQLQALADEVASSVQGTQATSGAVATVIASSVKAGLGGIGVSVSLQVGGVAAQPASIIMGM